MKKPTRYITIILFFAFVLSIITGCTNKVEELINDGDYYQAKELILEDEEKYKDYKNEVFYHLGTEYYDNESYKEAYDHLSQIDYKDSKDKAQKAQEYYNTQESVEKVMDEYNDILDEMDSKSRNGYWYYMNLGYKLDVLKKSAKNNSLEDCESLFETIFGYKPESIKEVNDNVANLQKYIIWDENEYFIYHVNELIGSNYTTGERDSNSGSITISKVDKFLEDKKISHRTLACMLVVFNDYGCTVESNKNTIVIKCEKATRGYDFCITSDDSNSSFPNKNTVSLETTSDSHVKITINNTTKKLKFFSLYIYFTDSNGNKITSDYKRIENTTKKKISYTTEDKISSYSFNYSYYVMAEYDE